MKTTTVLISILVLITAWVVMVGCYSNIEWAEETGLIYSTTYVNEDNWESCGFAPGVGAFHYGPIYGVHYIIISEELKEDPSYLDHELRHARDPEWVHREVK